MRPQTIFAYTGARLVSSSFMWVAGVCVVFLSQQTRVDEIDPATNASRMAFTIPAFLGKVFDLP